MDFNSILIGSDDPARLVEYYTKLLGAPAFSDGGYTAWQVGAGWVTLRAALRGQGRAMPSPAGLIWNIETKDVKGDFERMKAAGAIVVREPYDFDADGQITTTSIATFADPDGNYFQLMSPFEM